MAGEVLSTRALVRATLMRGTLHLLPATDFVRLRSAIAPAVGAGMEKKGTVVVESLRRVKAGERKAIEAEAEALAAFAEPGAKRRAVRFD